jgi:hypothetical protein
MKKASKRDLNGTKSGWKMPFTAGYRGIWQRLETAAVATFKRFFPL